MSSGVFVIEKGGERFDKVVAEKLTDISRSRIKDLISNGQILLNGEKVKAGEIVKSGQEIG